jgi:tetratricopeptide (TPR) repeat protein
VREEAWTEADSLYRRWFPTSEPPLHERAVIAHLRRDSLLVRQLIAEAATAPGRRPGLGGLAVARYFREMDNAERFARAGLTSSKTPELRAFHHRTLGELALARGRRADARTEFLQAERHSAGMRSQRALAAVIPFLPPASDLNELIRDYESISAPATGTELERALAQHVNIYLLGLLKSAAGDYAAAERLAVQLDQLPAPVAGAAVSRALAQTVRADVAWRRNRYADVITLLEPVNGDIPSDLLMSPAFAQEHARYLRADAYLRLGNRQEALRWFRYGFHGTPNEVAYMAPVHLRLGEIYDDLGNRDQAAKHYGIALSLWDRADPDLAPLMENARRRGNEPGRPRSDPQPKQ